MAGTRWRQWVFWAVAAMVVGPACYWSFLFCSEFAARSRRAAAFNQTHHSVERAALGLRAASARKQVPEALRRTPNGGVGLSWRVGLLPYLPGGEAFGPFDFNDGWDGPTNGPLLAPLKAWQLPEDGPDSTETAFRVFTGGGAFWDQSGKPRYDLGQIPDGAATTGLVWLAAERVPWTKADELRYAPDLPVPPLVPRWYGMSHPRTSPGVTLVGMADGSVRSVAGDVSEAVLRAMITADGREQVSLWD